MLRKLRSDLLVARVLPSENHLVYLPWPPILFFHCGHSPLSNFSGVERPFHESRKPGTAVLSVGLVRHLSIPGSTEQNIPAEVLARRRGGKGLSVNSESDFLVVVYRG